MPRPKPGRLHSRRFLASFEPVESRLLLSTFTVTTTADRGPGSLRAAITASDMPHAGSDTIDFAIPASTAQNLDVAVPGFDPASQTWKIALNSPLPPLTHQVTIDGFTQGLVGIPFRYPSQTTSQTIVISGNPIGGTYTLTTAGPLPVGTTAPIPYDATSAQVAQALSMIPGLAGDVVPVPGSMAEVAFVGPYDGLTISPLSGDAGGLITQPGTVALVNPVVNPPVMPTEITSAPNTLAPLDGNNATSRLILDGSRIVGPSTGLQVAASDSMVRGLIVDGFGVGISVPVQGVVGDRIQGDDIGKYPLFLVDTVTGQPIPGPGEIVIGGRGNSLQGVVLASTNATVGGVESQDDDVIIGNGAQGVAILPGAQGNQVLGSQIGVIGPFPTIGVYFTVPNGSDGVLIADSSNYVGGAVPNAGNLIAGNLGDGVDLVGPAATRNNILGNYIGNGPGGGFRFGSDNPGNLGDGVALNNAGANLIGGVSAAGANIISGNSGAGVRIFGASAQHNLVQGNLIGLTADGISALGNAQEGVAISSANNTVGAGNVISANLQGVLLTGVGAIGNVVQGNRIGTNATGTADLGNAQEGVLIDGALDNLVVGDTLGSQIISGNNIGLLILGATATGNQALGNFIGTDVTGKLDLGNAQAGVEIADAPANAIGGPTAPDRNLISANYWGVLISGPSATGNVVQGDLIGTDVTGLASLGNEQGNVLINLDASRNLIGGPTVGAGNTIAFGRGDSVRIEDNSVSNSILTNAIFGNSGLGIDLVASAGATPNRLQAAPTVTGVATTTNSTVLSGVLASTPNSTFTIQFFANLPFDPTGQGRTFLGQVLATTSADGFASFTANVPATLAAGQFVTATATDAAGDTSEFSGPVAEVVGTVQFAMASSIVGEGGGVATIVATRTGGSGGLFTVNYSTADGTAQAGVAYLPASGTLTFQPGQDVQTFNVPILNDGQPSGDTMVLLNLSNPRGPIALGAQSTAVLTILGNQPGAFQFAMAGFAVDQAAGTATITVDRQQGGTAATVNYGTLNGTALAGIDYLPTSGTLTFGPGVLVETFTVPILMNPTIKGNESVLLSLSSPTGGATLAPPSSAVLTIIDDGLNRQGPHVTSVKAISGPYGTAEIVVGFDEPLDPTRAVDLLNYGYSVRTVGKDGKLGTADDKLVGLCPVTYDPAALTMTLPLAVAVPANTKLQLMINQATDVQGQAVGVADLLGNLLDGNNDGHPGGSYSAVVVAQPAPKAKKVAAAKAATRHPVKVAPKPTKGGKNPLGKGR